VRARLRPCPGDLATQRTLCIVAWHAPRRTRPGRVITVMDPRFGGYSCDDGGVFYWCPRRSGPLPGAHLPALSEASKTCPREGPAIIASNTSHSADHFFGPLPAAAKVTYLAKAEYFTGRAGEGPAQQGFFLAGWGRSRWTGGRPGQRAAINTGLPRTGPGQAARHLPEGTRTPDGRSTGARPGGPAALDRGAGDPLRHARTFQLMPVRQADPRLRYRPGVRFGKPLDFSRYAGLESRPARAAPVTDEIMYAIMGPGQPGVRGRGRAAGQGSG